MKRLYKNVKFGVFVLLVITNIKLFGGTHTLTGFIFQSETKDPMVGVNVILIGTDLGVATLSDGSFSILNVPNGKYDILCSAIGYENYKAKISIPHLGKLNIPMIETFLQMEHVVVTGTRNQQINTSSAVATEVISRNDIEESGARDVAELLEERAGISVSASKEGGKVINMLGMDSKYILVMVDGQPIIGKFNSRLNLDQISTAVIDKIEIIKGPSSSLYGSEAMGGVINIITKRNIYQNPFSLTMRYSGGLTSPIKESFNPIDLGVGKRDIRLNLNGQMKNVVFHSDIDYLNANVDKNLQYIDVDDYNKYSVRGDVNWTVNEMHSLKFNTGRFYNNEQNHSTLLDGQTRIIKNNYNGDYNLSLNDRLNVQGVLHNENYTRQYTEVRPQTGDLVRSDTTLEGKTELEIHTIYHDENKTINIGSEFWIESYSNARVDDGKDQLLKGVGYYFQYEKPISDDFTIVTGLRSDNNNEMEKGIVSPRFASMYKISDRYKIRASWGKGFRMPSFMDKYMDWNHWQFGYAIIGNPDLVPETSSGYNIGLEYYHPGKYKYSITFYRTIFDNMIIDDQVEPGLFTYSNIDRVIFTGIEVQHRANYTKNFTGYFAYNLSHNRNVVTNEVVPGSPEHSGNIKLSYKNSSSKLRSSFKIKIVAPYKVQEFVPDGSGEEVNEGYFDIRDRDGYLLLDIDSRYKISPKLTVSFGIRNINNVMDQLYGPFVGRTVYLELKTKF